MNTDIVSAASDLVMAAKHPSHADGGPCDGCAFRAGTQANRTLHTVTLARLCVEGSRPFYCHEHPGLCRGFVAAMNVRGLVAADEAARHRAECMGVAADLLGEAIARAKADQDAVTK